MWLVGCFSMGEPTGDNALLRPKTRTSARKWKKGAGKAPSFDKASVERARSLTEDYCFELDAVRHLIRFVHTRVTLTHMSVGARRTRSTRSSFRIVIYVRIWEILIALVMSVRR